MSVLENLSSILDFHESNTILGILDDTKLYFSVQKIIHKGKMNHTKT